jgi:purine-binding chemotaxis protein CheW
MARRGTSPTTTTTATSPKRRGNKRAPETVVVKESEPKLATPTTTPGIEQLLTFLIGQDEYGMSILRVREIAEYRPLTPVPTTPPWMRGVMNLRGTVVPVVDLAAKLGLEPTRVSRRTCLVIVELEADAEEMVMAVMVDGVSRVVDVPAEDIQEPPPFGLAIDFVPGLVRVDQALVILLDMTAILSSAQLLAASAELLAVRTDLTAVPTDGASKDAAHARQ